MSQQIIYTRDLVSDLPAAVAAIAPDKTFVLADQTTARCALPLLHGTGLDAPERLITIPAGDTHKDLDALSSVWEALSRGGATRASCLVCVGGGMVTDLGGFAAATFKRGIALVNVPTTLLAMVDASVGGKTGINFAGLKNEVGAFHEARAVALCADFLRTLDAPNLLSGYAEMLKHALLRDEAMWRRHLLFRPDVPDWDELHQLIRLSVETKRDIVAQDPHERGLRKALNLGHTFGHALEAWALKRQPVLHGHAVAGGLLCELWLSAALTGFPTEKLRQTAAFIREHYPQLPITCDDYPELLAYMRHDKKNTGAGINCTLLAGIGDLRLNQRPSEEDIKQALDFYREG